MNSKDLPFEGAGTLLDQDVGCGLATASARTGLTRIWRSRHRSGVAAAGWRVLSLGYLFLSPQWRLFALLSTGV